MHSVSLLLFFFFIIIIIIIDCMSLIIEIIIKVLRNNKSTNTVYMSSLVCKNSKYKLR